MKMAVNLIEKTDKPLLKAYSVDGSFAFMSPSDKAEKKEITQITAFDIEQYGNVKHNKSIFRKHTNEAKKVPIKTLEQERLQRSQNLEEAWSVAKNQISVNRENASIQTDGFIPEESSSKDAISQTDLFVERLFHHQDDVTDTVDKETQLFKGELLDFDSEVEPILEELVAPIIEKALLEVMAEEENLAESIRQCWLKDKCNTSSVNGEMRRAWNSFQEEMNEELMISLLANNYVDDVLSAINCKGELNVQQKTTDDVQNFLPWFIGRIDHELEKLQEAYDTLTFHLH